MADHHDDSLSVAEFLTAAGLEHLVPAFAKERIDDVELLSELDEEMRGTSLGMKLGDQIKLGRALREHGLATKLPEEPAAGAVHASWDVPHAVDLSQPADDSSAPVPEYMNCIENEQARHWWST